MAARGSGIGASLTGGLGVKGSFGPSDTSTRTGSLYGQQRSNPMNQMGTHHWLWVLVALEIGFLILMRVVVFKDFHGG
jgi:hypothetical protein